MLLSASVPPVNLPNSGKPQQQQQFHTIPLGPQLQALWHREGPAKAMRHRRDKTKEIFAQLQSSPSCTIPLYDDIYHGHVYLQAVQDQHIGDDDMVVMLSIDGAQLYENKQSDCWIYIYGLSSTSLQKFVIVKTKFLLVVLYLVQTSLKTWIHFSFLAYTTLWHSITSPKSFKSGMRMRTGSLGHHFFIF